MVFFFGGKDKVSDGSRREEMRVRKSIKIKD
jgi:hypothetical protein